MKLVYRLDLNDYVCRLDFFKAFLAIGGEVYLV